MHTALIIGAVALAAIVGAGLALLLAIGLEGISSTPHRHHGSPQKRY